MEPYDKAVLQILSGSREGLNWFRLEVALSNLSLSRHLYLPEVLSSLVRRGLVCEAVDEVANRKSYSITEAGRIAFAEG